MRNILVMAATGAGAWYLMQSAQKLTTDMVQFSGSGANPMAGLLLPAAGVVGAVAGFLVASMIFPRRGY